MRFSAVLFISIFGIFGSVAQASDSLSSFRSCSPAEEQRACHTEGGYNGLPYCDCSGTGGAELGTTTGAIANTQSDAINCSHEDSLRTRTIYVSVQPTAHDGIFHATVSEKVRFTYSIPGEPLPLIAEYENVVHNQHMDLYFTHDGGFSLLLGAGQPHLRAGSLDMDVSCTQN